MPDKATSRCPATTRHVPSYSVVAVGVQCKYERGHDGDHAGHASFSEGDAFWPQDEREVMPSGPVPADDRSASVTSGPPEPDCPGCGGPHQPLRMVIVP